MGFLLRKLFLLVIFPIVGFSAFLFISRGMLYDYNVKADHSYRFDGKNAVIHQLEMNNGYVNLPSSMGLNHTSFLKVAVKSSIMGNLLQPSVRIAGDSGSEYQYFEHGAAGVRYLNVTNLIMAGDKRFKLTGENIILADQKASLIQFENVDFKGKRVLVLAPHPDDAEIAAFGLYSTLDDVYMVTVTSGDAGPFMYDEIYDDPVKHYLKKGEVRTWNSLTVPMLGGVHPDKILNLGYNDARLKRMAENENYVASGLYTDVSDMSTYRKQNTSPLAGDLEGINNWESLVENLVYLLDEIEPDIIVAPSPKLDQHSDHRFTTHALIEAIKKEGVDDGQLLLYTNHLRPFNENYPYGEAGGVISLPPTARGSNYFSGIYSHPMTLAQQKSKILALDAMSDLRLGTDFRYPLRAFGQAFETLWNNMLGDDQTYFRRAIRSNELFFVVDMEDVYDDEKLKGL